MKMHADSIDAAILDRIRKGPQDRVWTPLDFLDLGSRAAVDNTLSRNCKSGLISRAGRGLYHVPRNHPTLGSLGPSYDAMQDLVHRKAGGDVFPTGTHAANVLGLSDQVPMRSWHLTTGPNRRIRTGKSEIVLRHVSQRFAAQPLLGLGMATGTGRAHHGVLYSTSGNGRTAVVGRHGRDFKLPPCNLPNEEHTPRVQGAVQCGSTSPRSISDSVG